MRYLVKVSEIEYGDKVVAGAPTELKFVLRIGEGEDVADAALREVAAMTCSQNFECRLQWKKMRTRKKV